MNLNKVLLIGNLTRDPEMRALPSGQTVTTFGIATNRIWNDKSGKRQTSPEFHNIVAFGRLGEIAKQYLTKGKMVFIEGRIQTRSWEGQDGVKKNRTEIIVEQMQMGPRSSGQSTASADGYDASRSTPPQMPDQVETIEYPSDAGEINPDEIPF